MINALLFSNLCVKLRKFNVHSQDQTNKLAQLNTTKLPEPHDSVELLLRANKFATQKNAMPAKTLQFNITGPRDVNTFNHAFKNPNVLVMINVKMASTANLKSVLINV